MTNTKCFLCDLLDLSKTRNIKTLFEIEKLSDFESNLIIKKKYNACTQLNSTMLDFKSKKILQDLTI